MARTVDLQRRLVLLLVWGGVIACAGLALMWLVGRDPLRVLNVLVPLATLGALWAIWLRQRRLSIATQATLDETADVCARLTALSEALEAQYRQGPPAAPADHDPLAPYNRQRMH